MLFTKWDPERKKPQYALCTCRQMPYGFDRNDFFFLRLFISLICTSIHWMNGWDLRLITEDWKFYEWNLVLQSIVLGTYYMYKTFIDTFVEVNNTRLLRRYSKTQKLLPNKVIANFLNEIIVRARFSCELKCEHWTDRINDQNEPRFVFCMLCAIMNEWCLLIYAQMQLEKLNE